MVLMVLQENGSCQTQWLINLKHFREILRNTLASDIEVLIADVIKRWSSSICLAV